MSGAGLTPMASAVALLEAIDQHQLTVEYQGIFPVGSDDPVGFEALVRWDHPMAGRLAPAAFLPPDMGTGIGWAVFAHVLDEALGQCARWQRGGRPLGVSVNISPGRLADRVLPELVGELLDRHGLRADLLTIEVTEPRCVEDPEGMAGALCHLTEMGVRTSLDDFGTGVSNLARLRHLHFDEIKIDRSFVSAWGRAAVDGHIVEAITLLAHRLGSVVVAEGVETQPALDALTDLGVDRVQGFHLHRPAGAAAVACDFLAAPPRFSLRSPQH